jgi:hypothetical protein
VQGAGNMVFSVENLVFLVARHLKTEQFEEPRVIIATDLDVQHLQNLRYGSP